MLKKNALEKFYKFLRHNMPSPIGNLLALFRTEIRSPVSLSLKHRVRAYKHGFTSKGYKAYNIKNKDNLEHYLPDSLTPSIMSINPNSNLLDNKRIFYEYMESKGLCDYLPKLLGIINDGRFRGKNKIGDLLQDKKKIVLKPSTGFSATGVYICELAKENVILNERNKTIKDFYSLIKSLNQEYIVTEFSEQAEFLNDFYPKSANTIRICTITPEDEETFIPYAFLRIGTKKSRFVDNIHKGGLASLIDLETGELSKGVAIPPSGKVSWYVNHPDTSAKIEGFRIPNWKSLKKEVISIVSELPELKYVGWDILLKNENGKFVIIEGNSHPDVYPVQVYYPLLEDSRVRKFYRENGVPV